METMVRRFRDDRSASVPVEYGLIAVVMVTAIAAACQSIGTKTNSWIAAAGNGLS